jgi:AcrR family transcriptional regulator
MANVRDRQTRIAETAIRLFEEHGLDGTTSDMIAAEAGVSARTFFRYFKNKEAAAFPDHAERVAELSRRLADRTPSPEPVRDVVDISRASARGYFQDPDLYRPRYRLLRSNETLRDLERVFDRAYEDRLCEFLQASGIATPGARALAAAVVAVVNEALNAWSATGGEHIGEAVLEEGLNVVTRAFSHAFDPEPDPDAPLLISIPAGDPLRAQILAASGRLGADRESSIGRRTAR